MANIFSIFIFYILISSYDCVQIPTVNLSMYHNEEFVISELLSSSDVEDVYSEDEMIKDQEALKGNKPQKYWRLHKQSHARNSLIRQKKSDDLKTKMEPFWNNITQEDFLKKYNKAYDSPQIQEEDTDGNDYQYIDDDELTNKTSSYKRIKKSQSGSDDNKNNTEIELPDYEAYKKEYEKQMKELDEKNVTLEYNETKKGLIPEKVLETLVDFSPRNCTKEEMSKFSIGAVKCLWVEAKKPHFGGDRIKFNIIKKVIIIVLISVLVYLVIALPLWCQYGWCCCCCRCKCCNPRDQIEEIKRFYVKNPVGIHHDENGNVLKYAATNYEKYAQKKLGTALDRL